MFPTDFFPDVFPYFPTDFFPDSFEDVPAVPIAVTVYGPNPIATLYGPTPDPSIGGT